MAGRETEHRAREASVAGSATQPATELARGRRSDMPFLLVGWTALVVGAIAALLAGALLAVWWLG